MATPPLRQPFATLAGSSPLRRHWLHWWLPAVVAVVLGASTIALFALSSTKERGEAREQLVSDTLWVRESLQFQLGRETEALELVAADVAQGTLSGDVIQARFAVYLRRAREVLSTALVDGALNASARADREGAGADVLAQVPLAPAQSAMAKARGEGKPAYAAAFNATWGPGLALCVPVPGGNGAPGEFVVAVYSLDRLLEEMVPWTFAQENEVALADVAGTVRSRRASAGKGRGVYTHQEPLELPGLTLLLSANSLKGPPDWIAHALRGGIAALAAILFWSLWALWRDVQRRITAENRVREEAAFRRAMGDSAVIGLRARDMHGRISYVNPAFCRMVGYAEEELVGRDPPMPYWVPEFTDEYERRMDEVFSGRATQAAFETVLQRSSGERFPVMIYDAPLRDADGAQTGWMSSILDVSEQKQAEERERLREERMQTAARLTTMGEMASSLAHELNQPLAAITSYIAGSVNLLERGDADRAQIREALAKAEAQAQRAGQVIRRVHEFVRKQEPKRVQVDVAALLEDCRPLIDLQARREGVRTTINVEPGMAPAHGDPIMLQQVILNLTRNAIEAMARVRPDKRRLEIGASRVAESVCINVRDHGTGIADNATKQIFSPFFTTKPEGMGMGLSICRSIVEAHGGRLWFDRLEEGTEFHLQLPIAPGVPNLLGQSQ